MENKKIQDNELEQAAGGFYKVPLASMPICACCNTLLDLSAIPAKEVVDGAGNTVVYYQCPNCQKWVSLSGDIKDSL